MKKAITMKAPAEQVVKDIRRATRKLHSSEEQARRYYPAFVVRTALLNCAARKVEEGRPTVRGTVGPTKAQSLYYSWSKEFLEAGKKRLAGDTARKANTGEFKDLRAEALALKELVADFGHKTCPSNTTSAAIVRRSCSGI